MAGILPSLRKTSIPKLIKKCIRLFVEDNLLIAILLGLLE